MKATKISKSIATYKFNSIFIKTFAILAVFSLLLLLLFSGFIVNDSARELVEESRSANQSIVRQAAASADLILANLCANMRATLFNKNVISVVIAPRNQSYEKGVALTRQLSDSMRNDGLVKNALVYIALTDEVYAANGSISPRGDYQDHAALDEYLLRPYQNLLEMEEIPATDVFFFEDRLFLVQEFPDKPNVRVGVLIWELDQHRLLEQIRGLSGEVSRMAWVYRPDGVPLLPDTLTGDLPARLELPPPGAEEGAFPYEPAGADEQTLFYSRSRNTSWIFLYPVPSRELRFAFAFPPSRMIPFLIAFVVFSLALTLYITGLIYQPINHLIQTIASPQNSGIAAVAAKNEFDFLNMAFHEIRLSKDTFAAMMEGVTPAVLERVFTACLLGKDVEAETLEKTLRSLPTAFRATDRYVVLAAMIPGDFQADAAVLQQDVCIVSATNLIHSLLEEQGDFFTVRMEDNVIAVILRFAPDMSALRIKQSIIRFGNQLLSRVEKLPYPVRLGRGRIYNHVADLHFSYRIALEELTYETGEQLTADSEAIHDKAYFIGRIPHIVKQIEAQSYQMASELCGRIVDEVSRHVADPQTARDILCVLADALTGQLLRHKASAADPIVLNRVPVEQELEACDTVAGLCQVASGFYTEQLSLLEVYGKKELHRHILHAREMIDRQYADPGLSLNMVAEQVGIHPSYLSRLFKENLGVSFLDYLGELRVERAKELLRGTELAVKEIAQRIGFQSMPTFFRVFKKYCGMSPGQYRE